VVLEAALAVVAEGLFSDRDRTEACWNPKEVALLGRCRALGVVRRLLRGGHPVKGIQRRGQR
jgi:hypothetical protein